MTFEPHSLPSSFPLADDDLGVLEDERLPGLRVPFLSHTRLRSLIRTLREHHARGLVDMPLERVVRSVDAVAVRLLTPQDPLRDQALEHLGPHAGFTDPMAEEVLDGMARDWTRDRLEHLLRSEFSDPGVLDRFRKNPAGGRIRATGYPVTFHLGAGTVPGVAVSSLIRGLLVKSAVLLKPGRGDVVLPKLFAEGLRSADPELAESVAVAYWARSRGLTQVALDEADLVLVYGGDDTVGQVRSNLPTPTPLLAFRHRIGVGYVGAGDIGDGVGLELASAARAVALFDQRGCVSPHVFLVDRRGAIAPEEWARGLAAALESLEGDLPSGPLTPEEGAALYQFRGAGEVEAGAGVGEIYHGGPDAPWSVLYQPEGAVEPSCLGRTVRVVPVDCFTEAVDLLLPWATYLQTVGVARLGEERQAVMEGLARLGVSRITDLEKVPWPPPWWHQDGMSPLRSMVRWTDSEG
jgi:hypothetical protein